MSAGGPRRCKIKEYVRRTPMPPLVRSTAEFPLDAFRRAAGRRDHRIRRRPGRHADDGTRDGRMGARSPLVVLDGRRNSVSASRSARARGAQPARPFLERTDCGHSSRPTARRDDRDLRGHARGQHATRAHHEDQYDRQHAARISYVQRRSIRNALSLLVHPRLPRALAWRTGVSQSDRVRAERHQCSNMSRRSAAARSA